MFSGPRHSSPVEPLTIKNGIQIKNPKQTGVTVGALFLQLWGERGFMRLFSTRTAPAAARAPLDVLVASAPDSSSLRETRS